MLDLWQDGNGPEVCIWLYKVGFLLGIWKFLNCLHTFQIQNGSSVKWESFAYLYAESIWKTPISIWSGRSCKGCSVGNAGEDEWSCTIAQSHDGLSIPICTCLQKVQFNGSYAFIHCACLRFFWCIVQSLQISWASFCQCKGGQRGWTERKDEILWPYQNHQWLAYRWWNDTEASGRGDIRWWICQVHFVCWIHSIIDMNMGAGLNLFF